MKIKKEYKSFNMRVNDSEWKIVKTLKEKHSVNISGAFKNYLRKLLDTMERNEISIVR